MIRTIKTRSQRIVPDWVEVSRSARRPGVPSTTVSRLLVARSDPRSHSGLGRPRGRPGRGSQFSRINPGGWLETRPGLGYSSVMQTAFRYSLVLSLAFLPGRALPASEAQKPAEANLVVTGTLVCLDAFSKEMPCGESPGTFGLRVPGGKLYSLKKHENVDALFFEKRLQTREFRLTLRPAPASSVFELIRAQLMRSGSLYDFHYFCEVCSITTHAPGLCMCCREEMEYRENPAEQPNSH